MLFRSNLCPAAFGLVNGSIGVVQGFLPRHRPVWGKERAAAAAWVEAHKDGDVSARVVHQLKEAAGSGPWPVRGYGSPVVAFPREGQEDLLIAIPDMEERGDPVVPRVSKDTWASFQPGTYTQLKLKRKQRFFMRMRYCPLMAAHSGTVFRFQGDELQAAIVDLRDMNHPGEAFVALSRVRDWRHLHLLQDEKGDLHLHTIRAHPHAVQWVKICEEMMEEAVATAQGTLPMLDTQKITNATLELVMSDGGSHKRKRKASRLYE